MWIRCKDNTIINSKSIYCVFTKKRNKNGEYFADVYIKIKTGKYHTYNKLAYRYKTNSKEKCNAFIDWIMYGIWVDIADNNKYRLDLISAVKQYETYAETHACD